MDGVGSKGGGGGPADNHEEELTRAQKEATDAGLAYHSARLAHYGGPVSGTGGGGGGGGPVSGSGSMPAEHMIALQADYIKARNRLELVERHAPPRLITALKAAIQTTTGAMADLRDTGLQVTAATGRGIWGLAKGIKQWFEDQAEFPAAVAAGAPLGIRVPEIVAILREKAEGMLKGEAKEWHLAALDFRKSSGIKLLFATVEPEKQLALFQKLKATDAFTQKNIQPLYHPLVLLLKYVPLWMGFVREHRAAKMITQLILGPTTAAEAEKYSSSSQHSNVANAGTGHNYGPFDTIINEFTIRLVPILREIRDVSLDTWDTRPENKMFRDDLRAMFAELSEVIGVRQEGEASILAIKAGKERTLLRIMTDILKFLNSTEGTRKYIEDRLPSDIMRLLLEGAVFNANLSRPTVLEGAALEATEGLPHQMNEGGFPFQDFADGVQDSPDETFQTISVGVISPEEDRHGVAIREAEVRQRLIHNEQATAAALGGAPALKNNTGPRNAKRAKTGETGETGETGGLDALADAASKELARKDAAKYGDLAATLADENGGPRMAVILAALGKEGRGEKEGGGGGAEEEEEEEEEEGGGRGSGASSGGARRRIPKSKKKKTRAKNNPKTRNLFKRATRRRVKRCK